MTEQQIGEALKKKRGERSIREVAQKAGIMPSQVVAIEKAQTAYTFRTLLALAKEAGAEIKVE